MGLADQLFAGLGQGLAQGVQNYNQGMEQQQQMALRKQEAERQMQLFAMQKQQHEFDQGYKRNALVQHDMQGALARGDNQAAAGYIGDLNTARQGMGLAALPPVVGSPVAGTPAQAATPMGPTPTGQPMGLAARPAVAPHNDFSNPQTFNALASAADYTAPEPKLQSFAKGALVAHWDPKQHKMIQDFQVPDGSSGYTLAPGAVRVDAQGHIIARGEPKTHAAARGQFVTYTDDNGNPQIGFGDPTTGTIRPTGMAGRQANGGKPNPNWEGFSALRKSPGLEAKIEAAAAKHGVPPALFKGLLWQESRFNPNAKSPVGAMGLGQLMPGTAKDLGVRDAYNVDQNLDGAARYLRQQLDANHGDIDRTLASYNAGPGAVQQYGGVPPYRETQAYVRDVKDHTRRFEYTPPGPKPLTKKQVIDEVDAALRAEKPNPVMATPDEVAAFQAKRQAMLNKRLRETAAGGAPAQAPASQKPQSADDAAFSEWVNKKLGGT